LGDGAEGRKETLTVFTIRFSEDAERHLKGFSAREQRIITDAIEEQLTHQPTVPTRNRKQLRPNPLSTWELRVQQFRVLYSVDAEIVTVYVVAIAGKDGNKYLIEGEEYPL
jgi:mRNA-degrading endonuclease RelE of RelBE toxin-antitoxin system